MDIFELLLAKKLSGSGGGGGGGIIPSGTKTITTNGNNIDVYSYAKVNVNVPNPSTGKLDITTTSEVDVTNYASAQVVDADLVASNIKKDVNILGVVGTYEGSGGGGSDTQLKGLIDRTITSVTWPSGITEVGVYAFYGCRNLVIPEFPNSITKIGTSAFSGNVTGGSFNTGIASITATSLPSSLTTIGPQAFSGSDIAVATLPDGLIEIGNSAFSRCTNLHLTTLPSSLTTIGLGAFSQCTGLTTLTCNGNITTLGNTAFTGSGTRTMNLTDVRFPNLSISMGSVFGNSTVGNACTQLQILDAGLITAIQSNAFLNCIKLQTLILRKTSVVTLNNFNAFTSTPFSGYNNLSGVVYVPSSLISEYQSASNWSTLYNGGHLTFSAIEGSPYELS